MSVQTTTDPKAPTTAAHTAKRGCCGGETAAEPHTAKLAGHDHDCEVPSEAVESSCCCGSTKESGSVDPKNRSTASK